MVDINKPLRKSFADLLTGAVVYNSAIIPVTDWIQHKYDSANWFIAITNIVSQNNDTLGCWSRTALITVDITAISTAKIASAICDDIAAQVLGLVLPSFGETGLVAPSGLQFTNIFLGTDRYIEVDLVTEGLALRRLLTFSITVNIN